jgi:hypothetical protein
MSGGRPLRLVAGRSAGGDTVAPPLEEPPRGDGCKCYHLRSVAADPAPNPLWGRGNRRKASDRASTGPQSPAGARYERR